MRRTVITLWALLAIACESSVIAGMVVNEVSPTGGEDGPAWVELYNEGESYQVLSNMRIVSGGTISPVPQLIVQSHSLVILCDQQFGVGAFESRWGDSSGYWGDRSFEAAVMVVEMPLASGEVSDSVVLLDANGLTVSILRWEGGGDSLRSWERAPSFGDSAVQCLLGAGGTPGDANSTDSVDHDLAIEGITVRRTAAECEITIQIRNAGTMVTSATELIISEPTGSGDTIVSLAVPQLQSQGSVSLTGSISFSETYYPAIALLNDDGRHSNNHRLLMIVGDDYPPIMLSEIMAAPLPNGGGEWIELRRRADTAINLRGWSIQDTSRSALISDSLLIMSDSLALVAQSPNELLAVYGLLSAPVIDPASWATLNNSGDIIRLVDPYGIVADSCRYYDIAVDGISVARDPLAGPSGGWRTSIDHGGTPGASNRVLEESSSEPTLAATPQTLSPDGDGIDDETTFRVVAPVSAHCTLRIFDRNGRVVRTLLANQVLASNDIIWDGFGDNGGRLPIGIYVAFLEIDGSASVRQAVVIAR